MNAPASDVNSQPPLWTKRLPSKKNFVARDVQSQLPHGSDYFKAIAQMAAATPS